MAAFKAPDFNERTAAAKAAKQRALDQLRAKPAPDAATLAAQAAARDEREAAAAALSAAKKSAIADAKAAKQAAKAAAELEAANAAPAVKAVVVPELSAVEQKALRDARYAARKSRKR